jgi:hypothetical protein
MGRSLVHPAALGGVAFTPLADGAKGCRTTRTTGIGGWCDRPSSNGSLTGRLSVRREDPAGAAERSAISAFRSHGSVAAGCAVIIFRDDCTDVNAQYGILARGTFSRLEWLALVDTAVRSGLRVAPRTTPSTAPTGRCRTRSLRGQQWGDAKRCSAASSSRCSTARPAAQARLPAAWPSPGHGPRDWRRAVRTVAPGCGLPSSSCPDVNQTPANGEPRRRPPA